ncbi:hypothetical protein LEMLEM_LOCUS15940, partial [Lemmus lemmus]
KKITLSEVTSAQKDKYGLKWGRVSSSPYDETVHGRLVKLCCTKGTHGISRALQIKHTAALGMITPASSQRKAKFPGTKSLIPLKLWLQALPGLAKSAPEQGTQPCAFVAFPQGLWESLGSVWLSTPPARLISFPGSL